MLNLGVSTQRLSAKAGSGFTPKKLFDDGEEGFWYDISDIRTLKENSDGTVDVTTYGQSVGYIEDKSGNGNHARQSVTGARKPKYARHPAGGIRNLLTQTENFTDSAWTGYFQKPTLTTGQTDPLGGNTAMKWSAPSTTGGSGNTGGLILPDSDGVIEDNTNYTVSVYLKASTNVTVSIGLTDGAMSGVNLTTSWQRFSTTVQNNPSAIGRLFQIIEQTNDSVDIFIWGAQTEKSNEATPYQKVTTKYDVTEAGQPDLYYLMFDGTDDGFTVDSFSASAQGTSAFFGYSSNNVTAAEYRVLLDIQTGRLIFASRAGASGEIGYYSDPSWNDVADDGDIKVLSFNLQTSNGVMRENGTALLTDTSYVEKALGGTVTVGMHNVTSNNNFGGNLYQVVLRSTECNDRDLEATEKFIATKTGVSSRVRGLATLDLNFGANTYLATNSNGVSM